MRRLPFFALPLLALSACGPEGDDSAVSLGGELDVKSAAGGSCTAIVSRDKDWWWPKTCVVDGDATGFELLPLTVGSTSYANSTAVRNYLRRDFSTNPKEALGQQILTAKLNAAAFQIGDSPYADVDRNGDLETVDEVIANAEGFYTRGTATQRSRYTTFLSGINTAGAAYGVYFDTTCVADPEICDGVDNDGDGTVDEDCGCIEVCDGYDNDADGLTDESATDADGDGSGACLDCNDANAAVYPGAIEVANGIDDDCDGSIDEGTDGDGDGVTAAAGDCNDANAAVYPGATEVCDGIDQDCDGVADDGVLLTFYRDADGDGRGGSVTTTACSAPAGYVATSTDCNDASATVYPGATESCNGVDDDCDGAVDDGVLTTWYRDADGDGYGGSSTTSACAAPSGYVATSTDCNDGAATVFPGASETCNGVDDDCDASVDEGVTSRFYQDADGDGYGSTTVSTDACAAPSGYTSSTGDCNDASASVRPGAAETCNGIDDNCSGAVDEGVGSTWYRDADGDTYGTATVSTLACTQPSGYVATSSDCNDSNAAVNMAATEVCNGIDDDCDAGVDEGLSTTWYYDGDGDGYGRTSTTITQCATPSGFASRGGDCNDTTAAINPGATETCNSTDDDCDGSTDEGVTTTYYRDADGDGYGTSSTTTSACSAPSGYTTNATDCNDASASVNPAAAETCNSVDDDCDGSTDEGVTTTYYRDADGDGYGTSSTTSSACSAPSGYTTTSTDCNDANAAVKPGAVEVCGDGTDNDCSGSDLSCTYSFSANVQPIFNTYCTGCHGSSGGSAGLELASGYSYNDLVNVPSSQLSTMDRVEPGSSSTSYLYHKIAGTQSSVGGSGVRMPQGAAALSAANRSIIQTWINQGAPNN